MLGLGGEIDFRVLHQRIESGDAAAQLAYDVYIHRLRKYIGAYLAVLGAADVITFTAGVGENDAVVRRDALTGLAALGIELDEQLNAAPARRPAGSRPTTRRRPCWWFPPTRSLRSPGHARTSSSTDCGALERKHVVGIADLQKAPHPSAGVQDPGGAALERR